MTDTITSPIRLKALISTRLLDSAAEEGFDRFTRVARLALDVPVSLVSLIDYQRQFFKSVVGLSEPWASRRETPLSQSMCKRVVADGEALIVSDLAEDPRFAGDRGAAELGVVAYLGFPIRLHGEVLGSFCVIDTRPHQWAERDVAIVRELAAAVEAEIALRETTLQTVELAREAAKQDKGMAVLLDAIGEGVYGIDSDGKCTFMNRAGLEMLGYELDLVLGQDMHELIHHTRPDGSHYPGDECTILLNGGQSGRVVRLENEVLWRRDGTPFSAEYSSYPLRVDDQQLGSVLIFTNATLRQDAHKRLLLNHAVSRAFAEPGGEANVVARALAEIGTGLGWDIGAFWTQIPGGHALHCTATWASKSNGADAFLAATRSATLEAGHGLPGQVWQSGEPQIVADIFSYPHFTRRGPAKAAGLRAAFAFPAMAGSERVGVLEFFMRRPLDEEPVLFQSVMTLGELIGQFIKRQRTEDELLVMRRAIESTSTGIAISDARAPDMPLIFCNPAFETITGYTPEEAVGRNCRFLQSADTSQDELDEVRAALRQQRDCHVILQNTRKDGLPFWNELTISPVIRPDGTLTHFVGVQNDVTERLRAEAALASAKSAAEDANFAKSQFIANMSHELRTPMAAVIGYTELLEEEVVDLAVSGTETVLDDIRKIRGSARHLLNLINEVLDLSKVEAGKMELQLEDFELGPLMRDVLETVHSLVARKSNQIVADYDPSELGRMCSDPVKLRQCLFNLLSNAAKFTDHGQITVHAQREPGTDEGGGDRLRVRVSDTGIGMTREQMDRLFTRFTQADSSTTRRFGGTGLGLALTKSFCLLLGGDVTVSSEQGRGTSFEFCLPTDLTSARPLSLEGAAEPVTGHNRADVVLVIDDDAPTRDLITRFLAREGVASESANNGEDGLLLARRLKPRAILLDVLMPRMDGWAVLAALKADPDLNAIPVIMVSVVQERGLAFSLGAADFITKPVEWGRLRQTLERHQASGPVRTALLIEHDYAARDALCRMLVAEGWSVTEAATGDEALRMLDQTRPEMILLDLHTPEPGGLTLLNELRHRKNCLSIPVIAITEQSVTPEERQRLQGQVRRIIAADESQMLELASELRRIGTGREQREPAAEVAAEGNEHD